MRFFDRHRHVFQGGARPRTEARVAFIDEHRGKEGVEPIREVLPIAPSTHYEHKAALADPGKRSDRAKSDEELMPHIRRIWDDNFQAYGARKAWRQLAREGTTVAQVHDWAFDALHGAPGRGTGQGQAYNHRFRSGSAPSRPRSTTFRRGAAEPPMGRGLHVCSHLVWIRVCRFRDRRFRPHDRRMAGRDFHEYRPDARCARAGAMDPEG